ncbi:hypothetical protein AYL99_02545 [Fonsecaea erecta]|uniref:Hypervirulence associated protein TUDOR domain-containing protein n=1 Tax=Fonsecaea erecta TaxID=1367422 RepID=A0A178ZU83_9EURO|nr:hypothetical protein AYL99_02545 [Fonsecaea erecta]OAP63318.1 hypothetical protein AYL99_02545 [Fonsecaea erecta]
MSTSEEPEKGDKVTWNWGGGKPGGTVAEKKTEGEVAITSKRGNKVKKNAEPNNPAVHIERSGQDVVKKASELQVEEKANGDTGAAKADGKKEGSTEAETKNGEKRKHDDAEKEEDDKPDKASPLEENAEGKTVKKQKKEPTKKSGGAPKKAEEKKEEKKEEPKKTAGRPKKAEGALAKQKKQATPRATDGIGSRTRSQQKTT